VKRVVAASKDPNPVVSGKGIAKLRKGGVRVNTGVLRSAAELLNERFFTFMRTGLPFVGIKIAQTIDGYIADTRGGSKWVTSERSRREGHRLRAEYDAILVGAHTVEKDDPELTTRLAGMRNPIRVVLDGKLKAPIRSKVFDCASAGSVILTSDRALRSERTKVSQLLKCGVQVLGVGSNVMLDLRLALRTLAALGISSVLVECGSQTSSGFLNAGLAHRVHCFIAPKLLGGGLPGLQLMPPLRLDNSILLERVTWRKLGSEMMFEGSIRYR
jgi:diaminohydroxyphosphoribosylaminopyrimidine deaminase/5-amino-6-(5-phosphoribosylamino)uracil reductase